MNILDNVTVLWFAITVAACVVTGGVCYLLGENERLRAILARRRRWRVGR